jgi:hypothetical protein
MVGYSPLLMCDPRYSNSIRFNVNSITVSDDEIKTCQEK